MCVNASNRMGNRGTVYIIPVLVSMGHVWLNLVMFVSIQIKMEHKHLQVDMEFCISIV